ncbi:hypothetical protein CsatA_003182 [Cannabis sativa]
MPMDSLLLGSFTTPSILTKVGIIGEGAISGTLTFQALSIVSVSLLAVEKLSDFSPLFFARMLQHVH